MSRAALAPAIWKFRQKHFRQQKNSFYSTFFRSVALPWRSRLPALLLLLQSHQLGWKFKFSFHSCGHSNVMMNDIEFVIRSHPKALSKWLIEWFIQRNVFWHSNLVLRRVVRPFVQHPSDSSLFTESKFYALNVTSQLRKKGNADDSCVKFTAENRFSICFVCSPFAVGWASSFTTIWSFYNCLAVLRSFALQNCFLWCAIKRLAKAQRIIQVYRTLWESFLTNPFRQPARWFNLRNCSVSAGCNELQRKCSQRDAIKIDKFSPFKSMTLLSFFFPFLFEENFRRPSQSPFGCEKFLCRNLQTEFSCGNGKFSYF